MKSESVPIGFADHSPGIGKVHIQTKQYKNTKSIGYDSKIVGCK
jgi:hypothetical protein